MTVLLLKVASLLLRYKPPPWAPSPAVLLSETVLLVNMTLPAPIEPEKTASPPPLASFPTVLLPETVLSVRVAEPDRR